MKFWIFLLNVLLLPPTYSLDRDDLSDEEVWEIVEDEVKMSRGGRG